MRSRVWIVALTALLAASYLSERTEAEPGLPEPQSTVLFQDVRIFNGKSGSLSAPSNVLVRGDKIDKISTGPISIDNIANVTTIDGHTLMPGLIDVHWHAMLARPNPVEALASDIGYLNLLAANGGRNGKADGTSENSREFSETTVVITLTLPPEGRPASVLGPNAPGNPKPRLRLVPLGQSGAKGLPK